MSAILSQSRHLKRITIGALLVSAVIFLTYDIVITHFLSYKICYSEPLPKTYVKKTVEFPISVYWEDNVYPGYDEKDRLLMIRNYLDGVHIKKMALNGPDGTIYWYEGSPEDWQESKDIKAGKVKGNYFDTLNSEAVRIAERGKLYQKNEMPEVNYSVFFNVIPLGKIEHRYLWSDEIKIVNTSSQEVIGYNRRLMRRWYRIWPDIGMGNRYYALGSMCGRSSYSGFDKNIFIFFKSVLFQSAHTGINQHLFEVMERR